MSAASPLLRRAPIPGVSTFYVSMAMLLLACGARTGTIEHDSSLSVDGGPPDETSTDAARPDAATSRDAGRDAAGPMDAAPRPDAGPCVPVLCREGLPPDPDCRCIDSAVALPSADFHMGSPTSEAGRENDEVRHRVRITRALSIMSTEVTQAEWRRVVGNAPSRYEECGGDCPVESVSWTEALAFANLRSEEEGLTPCYTLHGCRGVLGRGCSEPEDPPPSSWSRCPSDFRCSEVVWAGLDCEGYRLPTEAEWEYAARAGSDGAFPIGDDIERVDEIGWCTSNGDRRTHPVAQKPPNPWGLFDMAGNVYEWVWDRYGPYPDVPLAIDPTGPPAGDTPSSVFRGGSFNFGDYACRSANRGARGPDSRENVAGFRLVRTVSR